jgi:transposase InsO family protein
MLKELHASHQGIERTPRRTRAAIYWPGINGDIKSTVDACDKCQEYRPSLAQEPMNADAPPSRPWEDTSADFFTLDGKDYLVYADRYSGWIEIQHFPHPPTASSTTAAFQNWFGQHGIPVRIRTDGGKQFTARQFQDFASAWKFNHVVSSPHYPQSNGHAEAAVKSLKRLLSKHQSVTSPEFIKGLIEMRNTPAPHGTSPAKACTGRPLRSLLPGMSQPDNTGLQEKLKEAQAKSALKYNLAAKTLPKLKIGQRVRVQDHVTRRFTIKGTVKKTAGDREYVIKTNRGGELVRNRRFIIANKESPQDTLEEIRAAEANEETQRKLRFKQKPEVKLIPAIGEESKEPEEMAEEPPKEIPLPRRSNRRRKKPAKMLD